MIKFQCFFCTKIVSAPDKAAGKEAKCPACGEALTVPSKAEQDNKWIEDVLQDENPSLPQEDQGLANSNLSPCVDCNAMISIRAKACPHCGAPTPQKYTIDYRDNVQTIQLTAKPIKLNIMLSTLLTIVGLIGIFMAGIVESSFLIYTSSFFFGCGFLWFLSARIKAWWEHG